MALKKGRVDSPPVPEGFCRRGEATATALCAMQSGLAVPRTNKARSSQDRGALRCRQHLIRKGVLAARNLRSERKTNKASELFRRRRSSSPVRHFDSRSDCETSSWAMKALPLSEARREHFEGFFISAICRRVNGRDGRRAKSVISAKSNSSVASQKRLAHIALTDFKRRFKATLEKIETTRSPELLGRPSYPVASLSTPPTPPTPRSAEKRAFRDSAHSTADNRILLLEA